MKKVVGHGLAGFSLVLASALACAAGAPVEEIGPDFSSYPQQSTPPTQQAQPKPSPGGANQAVVDLHYEVQSLREEVRTLRGMVEEQAHDLRELRQRQLDDYQDLDRRLGGAAAPSASSSPSKEIPMAATSPEAPEPAQEFATADEPVNDDAGEYEAYTQTYNLLKARKIDEAVAGFKTLVAKYPNGKYTANSYYWLGEIYLLQNNLPEAEKAFGAVTVSFPAHRKAPDAMFKLAKVYHLQGQNDRAKQLLTKVAAGNSSAASLAKAYLSENF
ncbi:MAG: tetratricopeptide repeat protein [Porticoccaceae bacterium]|nr:tetratricopeptide repeat protein [Porticoccaceae bacterium]